MPRLAIVISAVGTADLLEATLLTVLENRPDDCEVVAVTNFPYADPYQLAGEVRFVVQPAEADLLACVAAAIPLVRSPVVHPIAAGCEVTEGWADRALEHFSDLSVGAVAPLVLRADCRDQVLAAGFDYRAAGARRLRTRNWSGSKPPDRPWCSALFAGRVFPPLRPGGRRRLGHRVGCELADVEMAWALHRAGYRTLVEPAAHVYSGPLSPVRLSPFRQGLYAERQFWRECVGSRLVGCTVSPRLAGWLGDADPRHRPQLPGPAGGTRLRRDRRAALAGQSRPPA